MRPSDVIKREWGRLSSREKKNLLKDLEEGFPVSAFSSGLSTLEIAVVYLKENRNKTLTQIAEALNRNISTVAMTYRNARSKHKAPLRMSSSQKIPISIFHVREHPPLESVIGYLREERYTLKQIAGMLNRSYSTIANTYRKWRR